MQSENDTVAEIVNEQRNFAVQVYGVNQAPLSKVWKLADRIEASHRREVAKLNETIKSNLRVHKAAENAKSDKKEVGKGAERSE